MNAKCSTASGGDEERVPLVYVCRHNIFIFHDLLFCWNDHRVPPPGGWVATWCTLPVFPCADACELNPCGHGGACEMKRGVAVCACAFGFTGTFCENHGEPIMSLHLTSSPVGVNHSHRPSRARVIVCARAYIPVVSGAGVQPIPVLQLRSVRV